MLSTMINFTDDIMTTVHNDSPIKKQEACLNEIIIRWPPDKSDQIWANKNPKTDQYIKLPSKD